MYINTSYIDLENNAWCWQALETLCDASEGLISEDDLRTEFNSKK